MSQLRKWFARPRPCRSFGSWALVSIGASFFAMASIPPSDVSAQQPVGSQAAPAVPQAERRYLIEQAGSFAVTQIYADGFERLTPRERLLAFHLAEAGIAGDPIYYDQVAPYGLELKQLLEGIWTHPAGIDAAALEKIRRYTKQIWIQHGNYNLDNARKFLPEFTSAELRAAAHRALKNGANFAMNGDAKDNTQLDALLVRLERPVFDANYRPFLTAKTPPPGQDVVTASGNNLYENVTREDVEKIAEHYSLNSRVVKRDGRVFEEVWRAGTPDGKVPPGRYAEYIRRIISHLEQAAAVAEPAQAEELRKLIRYYETGEKSDWYGYCTAWVKSATTVDAINGFIEVYLDPLGAKGAFESVVSFVDTDQTKLMRAFADNAQYFENRAPWIDAYKKQNVRPPVANVITVLSEAGEGGPISPAGINLPNEQDIRQQYGTKSVLLFNITTAFAQATGEKSLREFSSSEEEIERGRKYYSEARKLMIAMHEVLGHGSGKVSDKLTGDPRIYLKEYYSTLEEARADLVALWDFADPKLTELGIADREELMRTAYDSEARGGLTLLYRYPHGGQIEEDHDRGTQMIVNYLMQKFGAIEAVTKDGKVYFRVADYAKMHAGVGELLAELMRIKAEGDYDAIRNLVGTYGVKLNIQWRDEVQERAKRIGLPTRGAFLSPIVEPLRDSSGTLTDARLRYTHDLAEVMLDYSRKSLGYLPSQ
jgi:dipeptidyl-peptidase-3